ncbi:Cell division cycle 5-like protein [Globisporangium polare]
MRIMIKGGVWKNTEDEILKAAVMKYGMNQWARVASLLSRKSGKQCKARWYEWLDPSIKKTEWSREEEEKLLHLAKLMPSQWRTIAPIVGRTAAQCMEHYERLLDAAQQKEGIDVSDDPRRLRPGEIDPNPENKPARPDPVDMDEDEKEMLSEARARLANTKGKKAKRKAREKQLEEARRLAALQKRRELKAAGVVGNKSHVKKRKFMDYTNEIPFEKAAPAGFYDVSDERRISNNSKLDAKTAARQVEKLDSMRRDQQEKKERKQDSKRQKGLMKQNLPQVVAAVNEKNDPINAIKRKPLSLPAPVVSNDELSDLAKLGMHAAHAAALALENSSSTETRALMGDYTATPLRTASTSTPAAHSRDIHDTIMQEAANILAMNRMSTPLLGGENAVLQEGTGYAGATPSRTPSSVRSANDKTPLASSTRTPLRDELGINPEQLYGMDAGKRAEKARQKRMLEDLKQGFGSLPAPQNEYEINIPVKEDDDGDNDDNALDEEDAGDREERLQQLRALEHERELKRRSQAVQKELPRPTKVKKALVNGGLEEISREMYAMIEFDIAKHPSEEQKKSSSSKKRKKSSAQVAMPQLRAFSDAQLEHARNMIQIEASLHEKESLWKTESPLMLESKWLDAQTHYLARAGGESKDDSSVQLVFAESPEDRIRAIKAEFEELKEMEQLLSKRAQKLDERVRVINGGFQRRSEQALASLRTLVAEYQNALIERSCFDDLASLEAVALQGRVVRLANDVNSQQLVEVQLQKKFAALVDEEPSR